MARCVAILSFALTARATDYTWTGNAAPPLSQNWSASQNWTPTGVPGGGDTATIGGDFNGGGQTVLVTAPVTVSGLTLNGSTLGGSSTLTVNGSFEARASTLAVAGGITINSGTMSFDPLDQSPAVESDLGCPLLIGASGSVAINGNAFLKYTAPVTIQNNGNFALNGNATLSFGNAGGQFVNNNSLTASGNTSISGGSSTAFFTNTPAGSVSVNSGTLGITGPSFASSGQFLTRNSLCFIQINMSYGLTMAFHDGATIAGPGTTILLGNNNSADGAVTVTGTLNGSGTLQLGSAGGGATLTNLGTLTIGGGGSAPGGGTLDWLGGVIQGNNANVAGVILVNSLGGRMIINGLAPLGLYSTCITNLGNIVWTNDADLTLGYDAQIINAGNFKAEHGNAAMAPLSSGEPGYEVASFQNSGVFQRDSNSTTNGTTIIQIPFTNSVGVAGPSRVEAQAGTLNFEGGGALQGNWYADNQTLIEFTSGTYSGSGSATALFSGGTALGLGGGSGRFVLSGNAIFDFGTAPSGPGGTLTVSAVTFEQDNGAIEGEGSLFFVQATNIWVSCDISLTNAGSGNPGLFIDPNSVMNIEGGGFSYAHSLSGGRLANYGVINLTTNAGGVSVGLVCDGVAVDNYGTFNFEADVDVDLETGITNSVFTNETGGGVVKSAANGTSRVGFLFNNLGLVQVQSGTLEFAAVNDQGTWNLNSGALKFDSLTTLNGKLQGSGQIIAAGGVINAGQMAAGYLGVAGAITNTGRVALGDAPGIFTPYNFTQPAAGRLVVPIQGTNTATPDFGQLAAGGNVVLGGALEVDIVNGYAPPVGASFNFLSSRLGLSGTFNSVIMPPGFALNYTSSGATLVVTGAVPAQIQLPQVSAGEFQFAFNTADGQTYTVQYSDDLSAPNWTLYTNFTGNGSLWQVTVPSPLAPHRFFRVSEP